MPDRIGELYPDPRLDNQDKLKTKNKKKNLLKIGGAVIVGAAVGVAAEQGIKKAVESIDENDSFEVSSDSRERGLPGEKYAIVGEGFNKENGHMVFVANILFGGKIYPLKYELDFDADSAHSIAIKAEQGQTAEGMTLRFTIKDKAGNNAEIDITEAVEGERALKVTIVQLIVFDGIKSDTIQIKPGRIEEIEYQSPDVFR